MAAFGENAKGNISMAHAAVIMKQVVSSRPKVQLLNGTTALTIYAEEPIRAPMHQPCPDDPCSGFAFLGAFASHLGHKRAYRKLNNTKYTLGIDCTTRGPFKCPKWAPRSGPGGGSRHLPYWDIQKSAQVRPFGMPALFGSLKSAQRAVNRDLQAA